MLHSVALYQSKQSAHVKIEGAQSDWVVVTYISVLSDMKV